MNRKNFKKHLKGIKELGEIEEKITKSFKLLDCDFNYFSLGKSITLAREILKEAMNDKYDYIDYFIYELDWGKNKMAKNCVEEKDGTKYSLQTMDQLYDYIIKFNI